MFIKMYFKFLKPVFVPRDWLNHPNDGGKTPREIIDYLMLLIARVRGQKKLVKNHRLHERRHYHEPWK